MTSIQWRDREEIRIVRVEGDLDTAGKERVETSFHEATREGPDTVVVDLSAATVVGSQGISMLLQANTELEARGRTLFVTGLRPHVRQAFEIVGVFHRIQEWEP